MTTKPSLRERKKERTRQALVDAATTLFGTKGYEETTIAELAEAADVSPRTFFTYFPSKEEVLFGGPPMKLGMSGALLGDPLPGERPAELLLRALGSLLETDSALTGKLSHLRITLIFKTPALQAYALRQVLEGQRELADGLVAAFPGEVDRVTAAALTGAVIGALVSTIAALFSDPELGAELAADPDRMRDEMYRALRSAHRQLGDMA